MDTFSKSDPSKMAYIFYLADLDVWFELCEKTAS